MPAWRRTEATPELSYLAGRQPLAAAALQLLSNAVAVTLADPEVLTHAVASLHRLLAHLVGQPAALAELGAYRSWPDVWRSLIAAASLEGAVGGARAAGAAAAAARAIGFLLLRGAASLPSVSIFEALAHDVALARATLAPAAAAGSPLRRFLDHLGSDEAPASAADAVAAARKLGDAAATERAPPCAAARERQLVIQSMLRALIAHGRACDAVLPLNVEELLKLEAARGGGGDDEARRLEPALDGESAAAG